MNPVVERRLSLWPNAKTRAEAAQLLYVKGWTLGRVLALYPDGVVSEDRGVKRGAARRAIWAHYALLQEAVGEPDIDPSDAAAVERVVRTKGVEVARCRAGSHLGEEYNTFPDLAWYERQAPPSWPIEADDDGRREREQADIRSAMCPECFCVHAGECP
ncbi:hypothetical protein BN971_01852 [Mycobacterium bohemicum DSM 44277]|uniref:Uncharacterized protein n=1 Tax=Mycobacterium bohemicum DSM 44277 TaxID=1236609 RepID=A0A0U0W8U9_MYCBE|nr:hypothetical protein BN971_01852 [Mycobacterium bohemicum DSM 44277]